MKFIAELTHNESTNSLLPLQTFSSSGVGVGMGAPSWIGSLSDGVAVASAARRAATVLFVLLSALMSTNRDDAGNVKYAAGVDAQR